MFLDTRNKKMYSLGVFVFCFEPHKQFFSYMVAVNITGDKAANFDLFLGTYGF
jgi:hypothetical protein